MFLTNVSQIIIYFFVFGRCILDNAMATMHVVFFFLRLKLEVAKEILLLKLDTNKAYEQIILDYLCDIVTKVGFYLQKWMNWIMLCVETIDYSLLTNDIIVGHILFLVEA